MTPPRLTVRRSATVHTGIEGTRYLVSDLHMGDGSPADDFAPHARLFRRFGAYVGWENVVSLGDAVEGWQCSARAIRYHYGTLLAKLRRGCSGNHDARLSPFGSVWAEGNVLGLHGHQADPWNARYWLVGRVLTAIVGWLERHGLPKAEQLEAWLSWTPARLRSFHEISSYLDARMEPWARRVLAGSPSTTLLAYGHTHEAHLTTLPSGPVIANCGSWVSHRHPPTAIRLTQDGAQLIEVS